MTSSHLVTGSRFARVLGVLVTVVTLLLSCDAPTPLEQTPNTAPTVEVTSPVAGTVLGLNQPVTIRVTASDADGTVDDVRFFVGGVLIGHDGSAPFEFVWTPVAAGAAQLQASATDDDDATTTSLGVNVSVAAPNSAPVVVITAPANGAALQLNQPIAITANATDPDGGIVEVRFFDGAELLGVDSSAPYSTSFTPATPGSHQLTARALDSDGASSVSAPVTVSVANALPTVSITSPVQGASLTLNSATTITATAQDAGGSVVQVRFYDDTTLIGTDGDSPYMASWTPTTPGSHVLTARAVDNLGGEGISAAVTVTVPNQLPVVAITSPADGSTLAIGTAATITADASDPDGRIFWVRFFDGTTQLGLDSIAPYSINWTPTTAGAHVLTARALGDFGTETTSAAVTVTVSNTAPSVSVTAPANGAVLVAGTATPFTAAASDPDGAVVEVRFLVNGTTVGIDSVAPYAISWTPPGVGSFSFTARATDNVGNETLSAAVVASVPNAPPTVILTSPAPGTVVGLGTTVGLTATASDADGQVVALEFLDGSTIIAVDSTFPYSVVWIPANAGVRQVAARATDDRGAVTTTPVSSIIVNASPTVSVISPAAGANLILGQAVNVSAAASDPDGSVIVVRFYEGSTQIGADSTSPYTISWTPAQAGSRALQARAEDDRGFIGVSAIVNVTASTAPNTRPAATITSPAIGVTYKGADVVHLAGSGSDAEDGTLPASRMTWWGELHHDTHTHPFLPDTSAASLDVTIPQSGHTETNVWYRFYLRVIDAEGVADTVYREIHPVTINLTVASERAGLELTLDGQPRVAPFTVPAVAGIIRELGVTSPQTVGDTVYSFASWSDSGDSVHTIVVPATNTTYTATFTATGPANTPPTVALTAPASNSDHLINQPVSLTATAADSDGIVARVSFYDGATLIGTDQTTPYAVSWTPTTGGPHVLTARAIDDDSAETVSTAVNVTVSSPVSDVTPPTVQLTSPANLDRGLSGTLTIAAGASDNIGVTGVELQVDGVTVLDDQVAPYTTTVATSAYASGVHVIRARARDAAGNRSPWATATVTFGGNVALPSGFSQTTLNGGLTGPATAMAFLPDGRLLVAQQNGGLRVYQNGTLLNTPMLTVSTTANGERGLLGVAHHPQFSSNRWIYVYYTTTSGGVHNRISRFRVATAGDTVETGETVIVDLPALDDPQVHNGGALNFGPDGKLYVAVGERGTASDAPRVQSAFGKILRYNDDGTVPSDNPFIGTSGAFTPIWAKGLRNPFTFSFSTAGRMFINDVGQENWEEINEGAAGADYGWPSREGPGSGGGFTYPIYVYGHSSDPGTNPSLVSGVAIVGATFYEPAINLFGSQYDGSYFFADFEGGWINRLDPAADNRAYAFAKLDRSMVDLKTGPDGALYVLAYTGAGWGVIRIFR